MPENIMSAGRELQDVPPEAETGEEDGGIRDNSDHRKPQGDSEVPPSCAAACKLHGHRRLWAPSCNLSQHPRKYTLPVRLTLITESGAVNA